MNKFVLVAVASIALLVIVSNFLSGETETTIETVNKPKNTSKSGTPGGPGSSSGTSGLESGLGIYSEPPKAPVTYGWAAIKVPAVDEEGKGVVTWLSVYSNAGEGRTLVNIDNLLFWVDTQYSIQTAKSVAENYTNANLSSIDLVYSIGTEANLIEGPSAGAALTVATIAAIYNKTLNSSVMITGTIRPDGSVGQVGGIAEKAKAAKDIGATLFIVPAGQSTETYYKPKRSCENIGPITYCTTEYAAETTDIKKQVGIDVKEVSSIGEALKYFIK